MATRKQRQYRHLNTPEAERLFLGSDEWEEILEQVCQDTLGHGHKAFLAKFNGGEYFFWPSGYPKYEQITMIFNLCPDNWIKPEFRGDYS